MKSKRASFVKFICFIKRQSPQKCRRGPEFRLIMFLFVIFVAVLVSYFRSFVLRSDEEWKERERGGRLDYARSWLVNGDGIPSVRSLYPLSSPSLALSENRRSSTHSHRSFYPIPFAAIPSTKFPVPVVSAFTFSPPESPFGRCLCRILDHDRSATAT